MTQHVQLIGRNKQYRLGKQHALGGLDVAYPSDEDYVSGYNSIPVQSRGRSLRLHQPEQGGQRKPTHQKAVYTNICLTPDVLELARDLAVKYEFTRANDKPNLSALITHLIRSAE